eukprot:6067571-Karenia_brevis.AAC.1
MASSNRSSQDELNGAYEYLVKQVEVLGKNLDDALGAHERRMQEIEDECKEKVDEIQDDLAQAMSTCSKDLEKNRKQSVARMRDTVREYKDNAKVAAE